MRCLRVLNQSPFEAFQSHLKKSDAYLLELFGTTILNLRMCSLKGASVSATSNSGTHYAAMREL